MRKELKILSIGNSFAMDTMEHLPNIALSLGVKRIKFAYLYIGGCSINRHWSNAKNDAPAYKYYTNDGTGWTIPEVFDTKISDAVKSERWDFISIQHGTGDGSKYTSAESYSNLPLLVEYIKNIAPDGTKIAFNMAWVGSPENDHHEIVSYNGNTHLMYENLVKLTYDVVGYVKGIDVISPTGTAIENARATILSNLLLRDGFHLSYGIGRYIAALTFFKSLTGIDIDNVKWAPDEVDDNARKLAIACANKSIKSPFGQI